MKRKYRVTNWPDYNRALVSRGEVTLWTFDAVLCGWRARGGKGKRYSDAAILCALSLRAVFKLPLRQTQGFLTSLKTLLGLTIPVPHYSTCSRRAAGLDVPRLTRPSGGGPVHLAIDSPPIRLGGLKVFGEGEWHMRQHGKGKRPSPWFLGPMAKPWLDWVPRCIWRSTQRPARFWPMR